MEVDVAIVVVEEEEKKVLGWKKRKALEIRSCIDFTYDVMKLGEIKERIF